MSRLNGRLRTKGKWGTESAENRKHAKGKERDGKMTGDGGRNNRAAEGRGRERGEGQWRLIPAPGPSPNQM